MIRMNEFVEQTINNLAVVIANLHVQNAQLSAQIANLSSENERLKMELDNKNDNTEVEV